MNTQNWLTLMEYSAHYRVSMSTLRRRIKTGEIEFKFIEGKYLIKNGPLQLKAAGHEPIAPPPKVSAPGLVAASIQSSPAPAPEPALATPPRTTAGAEPSADQFWEITQGLLAEIKKAYALVLKEKEAHIHQLQSETADLKTLVRVLEQENEKLKMPRPLLGADFDLGLEA